MSKVINVVQAVEMIPDGASVFIGGFMGVGSPHRIIAELVRQGRRNLTVIANDSARPGVGIGRLIDGKQVTRLVASHSAPGMALILEVQVLCGPVGRNR